MATGGAPVTVPSGPELVWATAQLAAPQIVEAAAATAASTVATAATLYAEVTGEGQPQADAAEAGARTRASPNPGGRLGSPAHRQKVDEVAAEVRDRGLEVEVEHYVRTPGGEKRGRFGRCRGA